MNQADSPVVSYAESPAALLAAHYRAVWQRGEPDMAEINPALDVESLGFARHAGDWFGVVITPWFLRLYLLPGGGTLWGEIPAGQRRFLELPGGTLPFVAAREAELGTYQFSTLITPMSLVPDMAAARQIAVDALQAFIFGMPSVVPPSPPAAPAVDTSRRGFFRRLAGKR